MSEISYTDLRLATSTISPSGKNFAIWQSFDFKPDYPIHTLQVSSRYLRQYPVPRQQTDRQKFYLCTFEWVVFVRVCGITQIPETETAFTRMYAKGASNSGLPILSGPWHRHAISERKHSAAFRRLMVPKTKLGTFTSSSRPVTARWVGLECLG